MDQHTSRGVACFATESMAPFPVKYFTTGPFPSNKHDHYDMPCARRHTCRTRGCRCSVSRPTLLSAVQACHSRVGSSCRWFSPGRIPLGTRWRPTLPARRVPGAVCVSSDSIVVAKLGAATSSRHKRAPNTLHSEIIHQLGEKIRKHVMVANDSLRASGTTLSAGAQL